MQLEMFVAVVEEGSVRAASERVLRTQPAVSIAISKLEREFEACVFDRSRRHQYRLTQTGEVLYKYATRMLRLRRETISAIGDIANLRLGRLRVGANESVSLHVLPKLAHSFLTLYPNICLEMKCERSKSLLSDLKERELDIALLSFRPEGGGLDAKFFMQDKLVLITAPTHSLAGKKRISIQDLGREPILRMDVSEPSPWHQEIKEAILRSKAKLHLTVENAPIETIKKIVAIGLGVAFVPLLAVREEKARGELSVVEVDGLRLERSVWLVRRRAAQSQAAKAFMECAMHFGESQAVTPAQGLLPDSQPARKREKVLPIERRGL